jgi:hypothetical protein
VECYPFPPPRVNKTNRFNNREQSTPATPWTYVWFVQAHDGADSKVPRLDARFEVLNSVVITVEQDGDKV